MTGAKPKLLVMTGPTGSGKTSLALNVAKRLNGAIINADSVAFYEGFDIGSAKPTGEERSAVPHFLFDVAKPDENFDVAAYVALARPIAREITEKGMVPLVVGGSGLYLRSLVRGLFAGPGRDEAYREELRKTEAEGISLHGLLKKLDPRAASRLHEKDRQRIVRALEVLNAEGTSIVDFQEGHGLSDDPFETLFLVTAPDPRTLRENQEI
ncbi:MAG: tRNA (adenosine(37)-N6)-dimethylallyltransferase MiaA, partial [Deltaproteobacteria bacterium]|nr:tRNA (adenosine(37)-N6)-dimethylallyltransferase MiaA [Deltaproteobacteria bacterium]